MEEVSEEGKFGGGGGGWRSRRRGGEIEGGCVGRWSGFHRCGTRAFDVPKGSGESYVDFLQGAVGDVADGLGKARTERRGEGGGIAFKTAKGYCNDDFVKFQGVGFCNDSYLRVLICKLYRFYGCDFGGQADIGLIKSGFRYAVEDNFVGACHKEVFCSLSVDSQRPYTLQCLRKIASR